MEPTEVTDQGNSKNGFISRCSSLQVREAG
jgi:hypothetical protein